MSKTPRTDAIDDSSWEGRLTDYGQYLTMMNHARQLERELAEAKRDTERLDWLRSELACEMDVDLPCTREAIDEVMRGEENDQPDEPYNGDPTTEIKDQRLMDE